MNLIDKFARAHEAVRFISRHDDQPVATRTSLLTKLKDYIDVELGAAKEREATAAAAAVTAVVTAARQ